MVLAIVPAYNEAKHIVSVVSDLRTVVDEVVVVNDCSIDDTAALAYHAGATVLSHAINRGAGAALETGHAYARLVGATYVVHFDGDGQFSAQEIHTALATLQKSQVDILFGSRFLLGNGKGLPWSKRYIIHPISRIIDRFFGSVRLTDVHNGFRILTPKALEKIEITQDRMAHASQIPQLVKKHGLTYVEFPITVTYHEYGQTARGGVLILKDLFVDRFLH